ncbi:MAG: SDR family NAD(P)-dependent oxidoreductase [Succinatimonas sp.]|jgi:3-hydroxy acid dehydrogenase/malonic semialdehyde reductase|nr:SDR family NAD(P)-dependent oxidoreductase [Succinatimonas sp.]MDD5868818.1 SDR family NAD(P)-dependent oxidoreductase [Succinatimonas sp.]MDY5721368.1 SDR family NAD(P)-dependent oxidoreductase [Succinivibrio sp.]
MSYYKTALVTGASAGFGLSITKLLANNGFKVIAAARRLDKLEAIAKECKNVFPLQLDVTKESDIDSLFDKLPDDYKNIDVLINNAGLALGTAKVQDSKLEDLNTMIATNVTGLVAMTQKLLPSFVKNNCGYVINLGSTAGSWPYTGGNVYGGTKAFVEQFSRNLRTDLQGTAVKVTVIKPGLCSDTEFSNVRYYGDDKKAAAVYTGTEAIKPEDIADVVLYLLNLPRHVNINELEMMPVCQTYGGLSVTRSLDLNKKD